MATAPTPYGAIPSPRQLQWHLVEAYGFIHFCINTFTDKEWGYGDESPALFNPTDFDAEQIVSTVAESGLKGLVLTCKHHDGFCLWPSQYTQHSVKNSPWKNGEGDMVREISDACRRHGLLFGVYLSPWDRNHKDYGRPEYLDYYRNQLRELLTNYGPIFEVWFDGANGGDGYYGGANEKRSIDNTTYYDWGNTWQIVRELQPDACMFSDGGPDIRWVGNESGYAGDPCWATINGADLLPGHADNSHLNRGDRNGTHWLPAEVDVSIRPGWFYHQREDDMVKSASHLVKIYFESVGRGANLILNLPPDRRGQIHENDAAALRAWQEVIGPTFATDFAQGATATASNFRGEDERFSPSQVLAHSPDTYWSTDDEVLSAELVLELGQPVTFNVVRLREYLPLGQRVTRFTLDFFKDGQWEEFAAAEGIGNQRLVLSDFVTTNQVRLRITEATACPAIREIGLFALSLPLDEPVITRNSKGQISISSSHDGAHIRYTLDGSEPTKLSTLYEDPFPLPRGGTVKARVFLLREQKQSAIRTAIFSISKHKWNVVSASSQAPDAPATNAIDEDAKTLWHTEISAASPHEIIVDMGENQTLSGFDFLPRQDRVSDGTPDRYTFFVSPELGDWGEPVASGELSNIRANRVRQSVLFATQKSGLYFRCVLENTIDKTGFLAVAEIGVIA